MSNFKIIVLVVLLVLLAGSIVVVYKLAKRQMPFVSSEWKSSPYTTRKRMINDLISSRVLIDKSEAEVQDLLGTPISRDRVATEYVWRYEVFEDAEGKNRKLRVFFYGEPPRVGSYGLLD
jgi:hypothetical protein